MVGDGHAMGVAARSTEGSFVMTIGSIRSRRARTGPDCIACGGGIPSHVQFPARTSRGNDMCTSAPTPIPFETNAKITTKLTLSTKVKRLVAGGRYDDYSPDILNERCKTGGYERTGGFQRSHRKCLSASDGPPRNIFGTRQFEKDSAESTASRRVPLRAKCDYQRARSRETPS